MQGICPAGWHIPTLLERTALEAIPAEDLRATTLWTVPDGNTNSTGFSALPAGTFNAANGRFEDLLSRTDFWSDHSDPAATVNALSLQYYCNTTMFSTNNAADAWSVRCVKNH